MNLLHLLLLVIGEIALSMCVLVFAGAALGPLSSSSGGIPDEHRFALQEAETHQDGKGRAVGSHFIPRCGRGVGG
jgi:hypothetical protein